MVYPQSRRTNLTGCPVYTKAWGKIGHCVPSISGPDSWLEGRAFWCRVRPRHQNLRISLLVPPHQLWRPSIKTCILAWAHPKKTSWGCSPVSCQPGSLGSAARFMAFWLRYCYVFSSLVFLCLPKLLAKSREESLKIPKPHISGNMKKEDRKTKLDDAQPQELIWDIGSRVS